MNVSPDGLEAYYDWVLKRMVASNRISSQRYTLRI
ncbi:hypothetical protein SAMN05216278_1280 [Halopelagius longus]|uniref:Uncharacterized protein n=1 Tax=Halopelagius longus TaxID=1236180 RepID=A0A1H1ADD4_9EURY|nr:hypothetical protein SAMN05216278_1280 [Halopelagius longus]